MMGEQRNCIRAKKVPKIPSMSSETVKKMKAAVAWQPCAGDSDGVTVVGAGAVSV
jgi:hypothetical protein